MLVKKVSIFAANLKKRLKRTKIAKLITKLCYTENKERRYNMNEKLIKQLKKITPEEEKYMKNSSEKLY